MNTSNNRSREQGYALLLVMVMALVGICIFAGIAGYTSTTVRLNDRNNLYNQSVAAAEAASETVLGYMDRDFINQSYDPTRTSYYGNFTPIQPFASGFQFSDGAGGTGRSFVSSTTTLVMTNLDSQFTGLYGLVYNCTVRSQAQPLGTRYNMKAAVQQDFQLATIPVFQFAIFYSMDLEINPGANMKVTGKVHGNANIYTCPSATLEYADDVGAVGRIYTNRAPDDPTPPGNGTLIFDKQHADGVSSLTLPISTNNDPQSVRQILKPPPFGENPASEMGKARYYNACDLVITTTPTNIMVQSGNWNGFALVDPDVNYGKTNASYSFVRSDTTFYDYREGAYTLTTEIDVGALGKWMTNTATHGGNTINQTALSQMNHNLNSVYVQDLRSPGTRLPAVRVVNGQSLPPSGLTVATDSPLYVKGHFNAPDTTVGQTNTSNTKPASLVGDAITILSGNWQDSYNSGTTLSSRNPSDTTVNAAFLGGIVMTTNYFGTKHYSGGVENFPRFLEDWGGHTLTYNGSMVVMFPSQYAKSFWQQTGAYYNAPLRKWAFDVNLLNPARLPPGTPCVRKLVRGHWQVVAAY